MPKAPKVEVFAQTTLFAGREVTVEVVVTADHDTNIEYIDARITGHQGWRVGSGKSAVTMRVEYPDLIARLTGEGRLRGGTSRYRTAFVLPAGMPPSHAMTPAWAWLELRVRVAIPWWLDGRYKFTLPVRVPPPIDVARTPFAVRSSADPEAPRIELSLASTRVIAGETVIGSCAVFHLDDKKPRDVELMLVPTFKLHRNGRIRERRGDGLSLSVTIPAGGAGTSVPFRFKLPDDVTPTFKAVSHELAWWLVAKSGSFFGKKVEVMMPLEICDASASALTEQLVAPPRLTDERISAAFAQLAADQGWQPAVDRDDPDQLLYERTVGDATLRLGYAYRGKDGAFLVARVIYPSLGLQLSVTPTSRLMSLVWQDIEVDLDSWDRAHYVTARSRTQVYPFLRGVAPAVQSATSALGTLRRFDDDEVVFERGVTGVERAELLHAATTLEMLARSLASIPVPAPPQFDIDAIQEWEQLAQRVNGELTRGDLSIEGSLEQRPVSIALDFDDERAIRVRAVVGDREAAFENTPLTDGELADGFTGATDIELVDGVASAALPITDRLDVARVKTLVLALRALLAHRDPNRGPYR
ncbi:MAG TPA: hypothetical protein VIV11_03165 [Kofleriaceae bacterium]